MIKKVTGLLACLLLVLLLAGIFIPIHVLQVEDADSGTGHPPIKYMQRVKPGEKFLLKWKHSVTLRYVTETYKINDDLTISLDEMVFDTNGPNLPAGPENGTKWEIANGRFRVYNYSMVFDAVPVRIGQVYADHAVIYNGKRIDLRCVDEPGGFVRLRVKRLSLLHYLWEEVNVWLN